MEPGRSYRELSDHLRRPRLSNRGGLAAVAEDPDWLDRLPRPAAVLRYRALERVWAWAGRRSLMQFQAAARPAYRATGLALRAKTLMRSGLSRCPRQPLSPPARET